MKIYKSFVAIFGEYQGIQVNFVFVAEDRRMHFIPPEIKGLIPLIFVTLGTLFSYLKPEERYSWARPTVRYSTLNFEYVCLLFSHIQAHIVPLFRMEEYLMQIMHIYPVY